MINYIKAAIMGFIGLWAYVHCTFYANPLKAQTSIEATLIILGAFGGIALVYYAVRIVLSARK